MTCDAWIDPKGIMLSEITQLYVESQKAELIETKRRMVVAWGWRMVGRGDNWSKIQTPGYNEKKFWGSNNLMTLVNNTLLSLESCYVIRCIKK